MRHPNAKRLFHILKFTGIFQINFDVIMNIFLNASFCNTLFYIYILWQNAAPYKWNKFFNLKINFSGIFQINFDVIMNIFLNASFCNTLFYIYILWQNAAPYKLNIIWMMYEQLLIQYLRDIWIINPNNILNKIHNNNVKWPHIFDVIMNNFFNASFCNTLIYIYILWQNAAPYKLNKINALWNELFLNFAINFI